MKRKILIAGILVVLILFVSLVAIWVKSPTTSLYIRNNTSQVVELFNCGDNPATIEPGKTQQIDQRPNDPHSACDVRAFDGQHYLGCLVIPTTTFRSGQRVKITSMTLTIPEGECGR